MRITRLFIDNYKCFVGFDFKPQAIQPIFGLNGTGKSLLFQALEGLRHFLLGRGHTQSLFPAQTLTRWENRDVQTFRVETESADGCFEYELLLQHDRRAGYARVSEERLMTDGELVFGRSEGDTRYFRDDGTLAPGALLDVRYSGIGLQNPSIESKRLGAFRRWAGSITNVAIDPWAISSRGEDEEQELDWGASNFTGWLRYLERQYPRAVSELVADLRGVIGGFEGIRLVPDGHARQLRVDLTHMGRPATEYDFGELSDGQRQLMVLYAVLHGFSRSNPILCMDEPANYLAPAEIQPYLSSLRDRVEDGIAQLFVATHNPEAINYLAPDGGVIFDREDGGPVKILPFPDVNPGGITAAELLSRGWID